MVFRRFTTLKLPLFIGHATLYRGTGKSVSTDRVEPLSPSWTWFVTKFADYFWHARGRTAFQPNGTIKPL